MRENHYAIHCAKDAKITMFPSSQDKHNASYYFLTCLEMAFTKSAPKIHKFIECTIAFEEKVRFLPKIFQIHYSKPPIFVDKLVKQLCHTPKSSSHWALLSSHTHFEHSNLAKNFGTKIGSRILFLGFEYFNAIYFSDLSIFPRFISQIWVFLLYLHLLFKELRLWQNIYIET